MTQTVPTKPQTPQAPTQSSGAVPAIAMGKTCSPNGIGLSH